MNLRIKKQLGRNQKGNIEKGLTEGDTYDRNFLMKDSLIKATKVQFHGHIPFTGHVKQKHRTQREGF